MRHNVFTNIFPALLPTNVSNIHDNPCQQSNKKKCEMEPLLKIKKIWERTVTSKTKTDRYLYPCLYKYISRSISILEDIISIAPTKKITTSKRERRVMMSTTADIRIVYVYSIFSNNKESYERKWREIFRAFFSHLISNNITLHASPALYFFFIMFEIK